MRKGKIHQIQWDEIRWCQIRIDELRLDWVWYNLIITLRWNKLRYINYDMIWYDELRWDAV